MGAKVIIALLAIGLAVIIACSALIVMFIAQDFRVLQESIRRSTPQPTFQPSTEYEGRLKGTGSPVAVISPETQSKDPSKANIVVAGLTAQDYRSSIPYVLYISGGINNTGGATAYNAYLQVKAYSSQGLVVDYSYDFGGITPHQGLGLGFAIEYTGPPIDKCTITPIYTGG